MDDDVVTFIFIGLGRMGFGCVFIKKGGRGHAVTNSRLAILRISFLGIIKESNLLWNVDIRVSIWVWESSPPRIACCIA